MKKIILVLLLFTYSFPVFTQNGGDTRTVEIPKIGPEVKIYPNPCKNNKITVDHQSKEISEIRLTNITGKQVFLKKYDFPKPKIQVQLTNIPNGIYLVQIKTSENQVTVKRLMVSKN